MTTYEKFATFIAIYAAVLSTGLFFNTVSENRKKLKIILEYIAFYNTMRIILINNSKRPITIENVSMKLDHDPVPKNSLFASEYNFPIKINGFDSYTIYLDEIIANFYLDSSASTKNITIIVDDIDNHSFTKFSFRIFNPKF